MRGLLLLAVGFIAFLATDSDVAAFILLAGIAVVGVLGFTESVRQARDKVRQDRYKRDPQTKQARAEASQRQAALDMATEAAARTRVMDRIRRSGEEWNRSLPSGRSLDVALDQLLPRCVEDPHVVRNTFENLARTTVPADARILGFDGGRSGVARVFTDRGIAVAEGAERFFAPAATVTITIEAMWIDPYAFVSVEAQHSSESGAPPAYEAEVLLNGVTHRPGPLQYAAMLWATREAIATARSTPVKPVTANSRAAREGPRARRRRASRPKPQLIRTDRDAELIAAQWMHYWGFTDAVCTAVGADAGIDVTSTSAIAQVKFEAKPVGRPVVQNLYGVAQ